MYMHVPNGIYFWKIYVKLHIFAAFWTGLVMHYEPDYEISCLYNILFPYGATFCISLKNKVVVLFETYISVRLSWKSYENLCIIRSVWLRKRKSEYSSSYFAFFILECSRNKNVAVFWEIFDTVFRDIFWTAFCVDQIHMVWVSVFSKSTTP